MVPICFVLAVELEVFKSGTGAGSFLRVVLIFSTGELQVF